MSEKSLGAVTIYGLYSGGRCFYVGSSIHPRTRESAHRARLPKCVKNPPKSWVMRQLCSFVAERSLDAFRAEAYWTLKLMLDGHEPQNPMEGWPKEAKHNVADWWPVISAWAGTKGIAPPARKYLTLDEAAVKSKRSKQAVSMLCTQGKIPGSVKVQGRWQIPPGALIPLGENPIAEQKKRAAKALALVSQGVKPYRAAKKTGIALSTIYRAIKRQKL